MRRPLSPHLQIYRVQISSGISAMHRITGVLLSIASGKVMVGLFVMTFFPETWNLLKPIMTPCTLKLSLSGFGSIWLFHTLASLRHLYWDTGRGLELHQVVRSGQALLGIWLIGTLGWVAFVWKGAWL